MLVHSRANTARLLPALTSIMQFLTLEKDIHLRSVGTLLKALSPAGYHNPRLKRLCAIFGDFSGHADGERRGLDRVGERHRKGPAKNRPRPLSQTVGNGSFFPH